MSLHLIYLKNEQSQWKTEDVPGQTKLLLQEMCSDWKFQGKQKDLKQFLSVNI